MLCRYVHSSPHCQSLSYLRATILLPWSIGIVCIKMSPSLGRLGLRMYVFPLCYAAAAAAARPVCTFNDCQSQLCETYSFAAKRASVVGVTLLGRLSVISMAVVVYR
jgi:hypothetical protein